MPSLCDLQMFLLLLFFATPNLLQRSKKALEESCSRVTFGPLLKKQQFVSRLVLAYKGCEVDESPPGTKEIGEVFGAKQTKRTKRRGLIKLTVILTSPLASLALVWLERST